jgi:SNF2 family DNA or RNA helicase
VGTVVFDEAHRLANRKTKVHKAARRVAYHADHVLHVTATKTMNGADDLWGLMHLLWPDVYSSYWRWVQEHCFVNETTFGGKVSQPVRLVNGLRPGAAEKIRAALDGYIIERNDRLGLDAPTQQVVSVTLTAKERRLYDQLHEHSFAEVGDDLLITPNAVALQTRLRQITSDWNQLVDENEPGSKARAVDELVRDLGQPVVIMAEYQETVRRIAELLRRAPALGVVEYHGGMAASQGAHSLDAFVTGQADVIVGTLASMREGLDGLQHRSHVLVLVDRPWNPAALDQAVGRLQRDGQTSGVLVYHVVAEGSADQRVAEVLSDKGDINDALRVSPAAVG